MEKTLTLLIPADEGKSVPNNFDLIRVAMALLVVWSHSFALYLRSESTEPLSVLTGAVINSGEFAVQVFFIVSGFLIAQSFQRSSSAASFLKKRVLRIHPGYIVATSICAFVILPLYAHTGYSLADIVKTLGLNALLRGYFVNKVPFSSNPTPTMNGSLWSIPYEFWCYIGVMIAGWLGILRRRRLALVGLIVLATLTHVWLDFSGRRPGGGLVEVVFGWQYEWFFVLPSFAYGMLAYVYREHLPRRLWIACAGPVLALAICHLPLPMPLKQSVGYAALQPALAYSVFYFAFSRQVVNAARFGDFSYGTYLYAFPLQQILLAEFSRLAFAPFVLLSMGSSLAAGILSWHGVERWCKSSPRQRAAATLRAPASETLGVGLLADGNAVSAASPAATGGMTT